MVALAAQIAELKDRSSAQMLLNKQIPHIDRGVFTVALQTSGRYDAAQRFRHIGVDRIAEPWRVALIQRDAGRDIRSWGVQIAQLPFAIVSSKTGINDCVPVVGSWSPGNTEPRTEVVEPREIEIRPFRAVALNTA